MKLNFESLMRRIEGRTRTRKEPLNELQQDISALEILNDICKLLREVPNELYYLPINLFRFFPRDNPSTNVMKN